MKTCLHEKAIQTFEKNSTRNNQNRYRLWSSWLEYHSLFFSDREMSYLWFDKLYEKYQTVSKYGEQSNVQIESTFLSSIFKDDLLRHQIDSFRPIRERFKLKLRLDEVYPSQRWELGVVCIFIWVFKQLNREQLQTYIDKINAHSQACPYFLRYWGLKRKDLTCAWHIINRKLWFYLQVHVHENLSWKDNITGCNTTP